MRYSICYSDTFFLWHSISHDYIRDMMIDQRKCTKKVSIRLQNIFARQKGLNRERKNYCIISFWCSSHAFGSISCSLPDGFHRCTTDVTPTSWSVRVTHDRRVELDSASRSRIFPKQPPNFLWTMLRSLCRTGGVLLQVNRRSRHSFRLVSSS